MGSPQTFDLDTTYLALEAGTGVSAMAVTEDFWATVDQRDELRGGRLVGLMRYTEDWPTWEVHPEGDEVVWLLSGAIDLVLDEPAGERVVELRGRSACIVPQGVWHTAHVHEPGDALHITAGDGTQNRPVDPSG